MTANCHLIEYSSLFVRKKAVPPLPHDLPGLPLLQNTFFGYSAAYEAMPRRYMRIKLLLFSAGLYLFSFTDSIRRPPKKLKFIVRRLFPCLPELCVSGA